MTNLAATLFAIAALSNFAKCSTLQRPEITQYSFNLVDREVCCGDLGCFNSGGNFHVFLKRPFHVTPNCDVMNKLKLQLNTRASPGTIDDIEELNTDKTGTIAQSHFNATKKTFVIIHGFRDHFQADWLKTMVKELLRAGDYNVIRMDWSAANGIPYFQAVSNLRLVGAYVGKFLLHLKDTYGLNPGLLHLIGHSLGAHGVGYAGQIVKAKSGVPVGRITGLDPAGPYFTDLDEEVRLDHTDADFVDTVVTNGDGKFSVAFGSPQAMGHVNFFPNGGKRQPGCSDRSYSEREVAVPENNTVDIMDTVAVGALNTLGCSHRRATTLFSESINSRSGMKTFECSSYDKFLRGDCFSCADGECATFGYHADKSSMVKGQTKKYFTITRDVSPYLSNPYKITFSIQNKTTSNDSAKKLADVYVTLVGTQGTSGKRRLADDDSMELYPGETYSYIMEAQKDLGTINSIILQWNHHENSLWSFKRSSNAYIWLTGEIILKDGNQLVSTFSVKPENAKLEKNKDLKVEITDSYQE